MSPVQYHKGKFPPKGLNWERILPLIGPASGALARFDGTLNAVPNASVLLTPLTTQEAVLSSRIEGTRASMAEVLEFEAGQEQEDISKRYDIQEVINYRIALNRSTKFLNK